MQSMKAQWRIGLAMTLLALQASAQDDHRHRGDAVRGNPQQLRFDGRYHHDHYYPARGYVAPALPRGAVNIGYRGGSYYFHSGVWFRPWGPRFVVVAPPIGITAPLLPAGYVTLSIGGSPFYYANGAYYTATPGVGYTVVTPPPGADTAAAPPLPPAAPDPVIYPRNGQPPEQTEADRQACNSWATTQPSAVADASVFQRAVAACMDGRGYTLR